MRQNSRLKTELLAKNNRHEIIPGFAGFFENSCGGN